jgi:Fe-S cluster biogenesis protein NfuA/tetratricopeptide (TPR) repeat protein
VLTPQPLGIWSGPAGELLLPEIPAGEGAALARLLRGELGDLPAAWTFFAHAVRGDADAALAAIEGDDALAAYNRFVFTSAREAFDDLRLRATGDLASLVRLAAYRRGFIAAPPQPRSSDPVILATLLAGEAFARRAVEDDGPLDGLRAAAEAASAASPLLAARYYSDWVALAGEGTADPDVLLQALRRARELARGSALAETKAELALQYGMLCQASAGERKALLLEAVAAYQEALAVFRREGEFAERYALAHMNLAVAYLAMPGEGEAAHLRPAIAIGSLREALKVFARDTNPYWWATATMNLATALQEAPTARPAEHLTEAVALYDDVLDVRRVERDPIAIARTQANAGNALVRLGEFVRAVPRLEEAAQLFEAEGDTAAAAAVRAVLKEAMTRSHEPKREAEVDFDVVARRADEALEAVRALEDEPARAKALALKDALEALTRSGLVALVRAVREDERGRELLRAALERPEVYALLTMHGIIRPSSAHRVAAVIEELRPGVRSHGGDVELVRVEGNVAIVRMSGACSGCGSAAQTLKVGIEAAVCARVPEIVRVEQESEPASDPLPAGFAVLDASPA